MEILKSINRKASKYFDFSYLLKFLSILLLFYCFYRVCISIANPASRIYSPYISQHLHYGNWLRSSILNTANAFDHALGLDTYLKDPKTLKVRNGRSVLMARQCLGLEIMGFWIAFILAQSTGWKRKLAWCAAGVASIWFINCWRVALLLFALQKRWAPIENIDHHKMFNIVAYALVIFMIWLYNTRSVNNGQLTVDNGQ